MPRPPGPARLTVAALVTALATGCGTTSGPSDGPRDEQVELAHVHGLGVDPTDGALYAGSHHGLFRVTEDGGVSGPVADLIQDFMGFTVVGPEHFIASGHPGLGADGPRHLGLIESTDGGETWSTRSLAGEADFHSLTYRHDRAYGVNATSGELLVSSDLEEWETRSTRPIVDIAVSPDDAGTIVATTEQGPMVSTDGGRSFEGWPGAPLLVLVSWADDGTLVGVDPDGTVHVRPAGRDVFVRAGSLRGHPEAVHAQDAATVYAAAGGTLWRSTDGGRSFQPFPAD